MTMDEYEAMRRIAASERESVGAREAEVKPKRKPSSYNRAYAREYRKLRAAHPRMSHAAITKKAHRAVKRSKK